MSYPTLPSTPAQQKLAVPGTYLQTPGPHTVHVPPSTSNVPLISPTTPPPQAAAAAPATASTLPKLPPAVSKDVTQTLSSEERAARTINDCLAQESRYPDLDSYLSQGFSSDYDIPTSPAWTPFHKVKTYGIPDQIFEQYNRAQVSTGMGLFAELSHAWVAIDNALYIWDYTKSNPPLVGFEDQPNSISTVRLATPRSDVFLPAVKYVLVIATTAEIILLGVSCEETASGGKQLGLYQTGMSTPIRGLDINVFAVSNSTGRIFFGGSSDNDVWELTYQQEERWFQGRCAKVNHTSSRMAAFVPSLSFTNLAPKAAEKMKQMEVDDSRKLLYTLSSTSTIRVFHMKPDGTLTIAITRHASDIYSNIGHIITSNETLNAKVPIVSISPIPAAEASRYHLMATTATGYRIYLSATGSYSWSPVSNSTNPPTSMQAHYVRTPPLDASFTASVPSTPQVPGRYQSPINSKVPIRTLEPTRFAVRFPPGYFLCFTAKDSMGPHSLFLSAPDSGRVARSQENVIPSKATETATWMSLGSSVEDVGLCSPVMGAATTPSGFGNELAVQFDHPAAQIAVMTNLGIDVVRRRRLVDVFAALVRGGGGEEGLEGEIKNFIRTYGRSETLATALAVACGQGVEISPDSRLTRINDRDVLDFARKVFIEYGGKPAMNENAVADNGTPAIDTFVPSPRHAGIALYISRLLRSMWKKEIVKVTKSPNGAQSITTSLGEAKLQGVQRDLQALQEFFKTNKTFIEGLSGPEALARVSTKQEETALLAEHRALHSLVQLVAHTIEGVSFVLVLFDERVDEIVAALPDDSKQRFLKLTFEELFSSSKGHDIAKELVKAIVNRNIAKGSNVETVADALRRRCGSFCSAEDVVIFKAQELLKRATEAGANSELGRNLLNESLHLFLQVSDNLPMDYLVSAVMNYIKNQFFAGAIQLALNVAARSDRSNLALAWIVDGRREDDSRKEFFDFRKHCYALVFKTIIAVDKLAASDPTMIDGQYTVIAKRKNEAYGVITDSNDEVFLTSLYDWYLEQGWSERLLRTDSPFVVTYLKHKADDDIEHADLLWRYYAQSERFFEAAEVQYGLARSAFALPLSRRIEYLGYARANASTHTPDVPRQTRQQLLQEISQLIDIANIQDEVLQRIKADSRIDASRRPAAIKEVDGPILDLKILFNTYADCGSYYDICLLIYYIADYRDSADITQTWQHLLQKTHDETAQKGEPQPYEAVIDMVRGLGGRLRMSEVIFPIPVILPMLERYALEYQRGIGPPTWIVDLFLDLDVPHEALFSVLESMYYTDDAPFQGFNRRYIVKDLLYVIQQWFHESVRLGGAVFGSESTAERVSETLLLVLQQGGIPPDLMQLAQGLRTRVEEIVQ